MKQRHVKLDDQTIQILNSAIVEGTLLKLTGQLDRPTYVKVDKAIKAMGGKWNRSKGGHVFNGCPREILGLSVETGKVFDRKKSLNAFYTPADLADYMAKVAGISGETELVLEPSAGGGALVKAAFDASAQNVLAVEVDQEAAGNLLHTFRDEPLRNYVASTPRPAMPGSPQKNRSLDRDSGAAWYQALTKIWAGYAHENFHIASFEFRCDRARLDRRRSAECA